MLYDGDLNIPKNYLVEPPKITDTLSEYICQAGIKSFAISETQKFGHVTYFWNGNRSGYFDDKLETYIEIPSERIEFDKSPEMKAFEITSKTIELLKSGEYRFGRVNFANGDMVGHTGKIDPTKKAVETVDTCIGKLLDAVKDCEGLAIITADHGNADEMYVNERGTKTAKTAHSRNLVPFAIYDPGYNNEYQLTKISNAGLANIASTILNLLGYEKVQDFEPSLIEFIS
jgi:2,3-bisphosphoglycerate-independent phosphoglycerate mutase